MMSLSSSLTLSSSSLLPPTMSVEALAEFYGISPNTRAGEGGAYACKGCDVEGAPLRCQLHNFAMLSLLRKQCDFVEMRHLARPWEKIISDCLDDFRLAFLGAATPSYYLQHGILTPHHEIWLQGKHVPINENENLRLLFDLDYRPASNYLNYGCVFRIFGPSSFFIAFDNGQYFLLGNLKSCPGRSFRYYYDYIKTIEKILMETKNDKEIDRRRIKLDYKLYV